MTSVTYTEAGLGTDAFWVFDADILDAGNPAGYLLESFEGADVTDVTGNTVTVHYDASFSALAQWTMDAATAAATFTNGGILQNGTGIATEV